jgi:hypothetical protein
MRPTTRRRRVPYMKKQWPRSGYLNSFLSLEAVSSRPLKIVAVAELMDRTRGGASGSSVRRRADRRPSGSGEAVRVWSGLRSLDRTRWDQ